MSSDDGESNASRLWKQNEEKVQEICSDVENGISKAHNILEEMNRQKEVMHNIQERLPHIANKVDYSQQITSSMKSKMIQPKLMVAVFLGFVFLIFCLIVAIKFFMIINK